MQACQDGKTRGDAQQAGFWQKHHCEGTRAPTLNEVPPWKKPSFRPHKSGVCLDSIAFFCSWTHVWLTGRLLLENWTRQQRSQWSDSRDDTSLVMKLADDTTGKCVALHRERNWVLFLGSGDSVLAYCSTILKTLSSKHGLSFTLP